VDSAALITAPAIEPITLEEAQTHLKVNGEDDYLTSLIITARMMVERYLNRSLLLQTWKAYASCWHVKMCLPYPPLLSVTSVKYYDVDGVLRTLTVNTEYWVNTADQPGNVQTVYDFSPPELQYGRPNSIEIEYTAGYRATGTDTEKRTAVPAQIKHAMKVLMTDLHEHRGQYVIGNQAHKLPGFVIDLIHTYKIYNP
jgi:uncharacterized phiE125 gp8 family phage protein